MIDKLKQSLLIIFFITSLISCSAISENKLAGTKWRSNDGNIHCDFTSRNTIEINYNNTQKDFLFYIEDDKIKITNRGDYSQYFMKC